MRHLEGVASVVEVVDPDILVLSEVSSPEACVALAALLREKGLGNFQAYHVEGRDSYTGFDVAFVSRVVPDRVEGELIHLFAPQPTPRLRDVVNGSAPLPWMAERYSRPQEEGDGVEAIAVLKRHAVCFFSLFGHKLGIIGLHLKSNPSDAQANAQRTAEAAIVRRIVQREIVDRGYLPVILGDLNDYDPDVEMADSTRKTETSVLRMLKDVDPQRDGDELVNVATRIPRVADRFSSHWDYNENGAADGDDVFTLIDHILVDKQLATGLKRAFICHANCLDISDHFPVIVDLNLSATSTSQ
jgi:exonuclease III